MRLPFEIFVFFSQEMQHKKKSLKADAKFAYSAYDW